jgi:hypothetical protein
MHSESSMRREPWWVSNQGIVSVDIFPRGYKAKLNWNTVYISRKSSEIGYPPPLLSHRWFLTSTFVLENCPRFCRIEHWQTAQCDMQKQIRRHMTGLSGVTWRGYQGHMTELPIIPCQEWASICKCGIKKITFQQLLLLCIGWNSFPMCTFRNMGFSLFKTLT